MSWLSRMFKRRSPVGEQKSVPFLVTVAPEADGFYPAVTFGGDSLETVLEAATWSYACITGNAKAIASLPGIVQRAGTDEDSQDWIKTRDQPALSEFIKAPIGVGLQPDWGWQHLIEVAAMQTLLCGNSYWEIRRVRRGERVLVKPIHPSNIDPVDASGATTGENPVKEYRVVQNGSIRTLRPSQVVHIANASPGSLLKGHSPLATALRPIQIDQTAHERQKGNLSNKIAPGLILSVEGLFGLAPEQRGEVEKFLKDNFQKASDDGRPLVLGEKTKVAAAPDTNKQLDYFDTRRFSREEMLAIFKTPPPIVGVYDAATLQNFAEARKIWWQTGLFPLLAQTILEAFNRQLVWPVFGSDLRLWFSLNDSDIGLQLFGEKVDTAQKLVTLGYPTNMAAERMGLGMPHVPELDIPNTQFVVAGRTDEESTEPEETEE